MLITVSCPADQELKSILSATHHMPVLQNLLHSKLRQVTNDVRGRWRLCAAVTVVLFDQNQK